MLPEKYQWIAAEFEPEGDPLLLLEVAGELEEAGNLPGAATVLDRAYGIAPEMETVRRRRAGVLDALAVVEHGLRFRYVPAGPFLMGRDGGEPDEGPWHPVWLSAFWMSETPVSWAAYCRLMDWEAPPRGFPRDWQPPYADVESGRFYLYEANKIRWRYCGWPQRGLPDTREYDETRPMVAVGWQEAQELAVRLSTGAVRYGLPTEAQWEKAARGGLIGARHAWGNEPPNHQCCDFDRFEEFSILPMTTFAPNGYGLYAVNGCVWEWTSGWYCGADRGRTARRWSR
jgi:formylglycine-generating enzyme required for sulfatase activity